MARRYSRGEAASALLPSFMFSIGNVLCLTLLTILCVVEFAASQCQSNSDFKFRPNFADGVSGRVIQNGLKHPRGITFDSASPPHLLAIDVGVGVIALTESPSGCDGWSKSTVFENTDINHGIWINGQELYISSSNDVFMFNNYNAGNATLVGSQTPVTLVTNMSNTDHTTRTLLYQPASGSQPPYLIVSRGSSENVDPGSADVSTGRGQIRRFALNTTTTHDWMDGELLMWGVRNGVGIALTPNNLLWEVENSSDDMQYQSVDVHEDNPAEELNFLNMSNPGEFGSYFGYPSCFTVWNMTVFNSSSTLKPGDQISIEANTSRTDEWCSDSSHVTKPRLSMQAHIAPLDIKFFTAPTSNTGSSIPADWHGHALVTAHGSWDRVNPAGYGIFRIPWGQNMPVASADSGQGYSFIMQAPDLSKCDQQCIRPAGLAIDSRGRLFGSSDSTGEIFVIENSNGSDVSFGTTLRPIRSLLYAALALALGLTKIP